MTKPTLKEKAVLFIVLLLSLSSIAQNFVPFDSANAYDNDLKGDILLIGNNILGPDNNPFNDNSVYNSNVDMRYIDIDGDPSTFSSSSADLTIPNPNCYEIKYAALYWGAVEREENQTTFNTVKFKGPSGGYQDITGTVIYDRYTDGGGSIQGSFPYACFADVTNIVTSLATDLGTYTVANVNSQEGFNGGTGQSAGWSLFVVFEDPTLPGKSITSYNGFSIIKGNPDPVGVDFDISGFRTVPSPTPVRANFAFAVLEGDSPILNDQLRLNGTPMSTTDRPVSNFFNSSVTQLNAQPVDNRVPNSTNTLGFDTGILAIPNPGNTIIANDATTANIELTTSGDTYFPYFFAMAVEIIEPDIALTKIVEDELGNNIGNQIVDLGQELNYIIGFQNVGNDNATNFTIRDILPINVIFDYPTGLTLPTGVSVASYDVASREIVFSIENYLVEENDPVYEIRIEAQVVEACQDLDDACSNIITNQAFATYQGTLNTTFLITDDPSYSQNTGCLITPQATNFLANLDCEFTQNEILCGDEITLTAADGYDTYSWSTSPTGTPVIGTTQSIVVTATGTYYSFNTALAPCQSIVQEYVVSLYGGTIPNPVIPFADEVVTCPNDGKLLPNIFLCGLDDFRDILTDIDGATSVIWEKLDETSCTAIPDIDCANENPGCTWDEVATGPNYTANEGGQFRLTINYEGGCFNQFYFNVYQNLLNPSVSVEDIICDTPGRITVHNVPSGYEYSLDGTNYQSSNVFTITVAGIYTVYIRQVGVPTNACVFTVPDVLVRERDFTISSIVEQPLCYGDKGNIYLAANDAEPQYYFSIYLGATLVNSVGPIVENNYAFENLNPGTYTVNIETEDGCTATEEIEIIEPPLLTLTAAITRPLTCTDGEITVYPQGGTAPYFYFVNNSTVFQTNPEVVVTTPGVYNITVVDANNCSAETSITIEAILAPEFTIEKTDIVCASNDDNGTITIQVSNPNGNSLEYSIDGGFNFSNSPLFTGLSAGNYFVTVRYTIGPAVCTSDIQNITIETVTPIDGTAVLVAPYTCISTGTIEAINVSGGTPPYQYSIDGINYQSSPTFTGLTPGNYSITIKDANDCTFITNEVEILPLDPPIDLMFTNTPVTCPTNTVTISIVGTTGGVTPLEYQIIAPASAATPYQTSTDFSDLAPDIYTFQVKDVNDCTYTEDYAVAPIAPISIIAETLNNVTCFGDATGSVQFTVSGTTSFNYTLNGGLPIIGTSPIILTNLSAGNYTIVVTDLNTTCQATTTATIEAPSNPLTVTVDVSPISCIETGSVVINATGGWGGNIYTLTLPDTTILPAQSSNIFTGLTQSGNYTVTVQDSNGCIVTENFDLVIPNAPEATITIDSDLCYDSSNGATIEVEVTAGEAPFEFSINGGPFQNSNIFSGLIPGTYTITVRDSFGCELTLPSQTVESQILVDAILTKTLDCTTSPDAIITGTITGGLSPFGYAVSINGGAFNSLGATGTPFTYSTATSGSYQFEITDALGCTATSPIIIIHPITLPAIDFVAQTQQILCNGDENGAINITIDPTVGTPPFVINVNNDTTNTNYGNQTAGLPAGAYTITVTDANECVATEIVTIDEPDPIIVDYEAFPIECDPSGGISQGSIVINSVVGGIPPYNYFVTGTNGYANSELNATGSTSVSFDVVDFGLYEINVVDSNGCSVLFQDVLVASQPTDLDITVDPTVDCALGGQVVVSVSSALGSMGPFWFSIYEGPGTVYPNPPGSWIPENPPGSQSTIFNDTNSTLIPGVTYTFIVYDTSTNCSYYESAGIPIPTNSTLTATAVSANNISCTGNDDGNVSFTVNNIYTTPVTIDYEIFDSLSTSPIGISGTGIVPAGGSLAVNDLGPIPFGNYFVLIEETVGPNAGCGVVTAPFNITESAILLSLSASVDQNANCNPDSGVIIAVAQNGTPPYAYQLTTTAAPPIATDPLWNTASVFNVNAGNYFVHALDAYGCIVSSPVQVVPMDPTPVIVATTTNECTAIEGQFEIEVALITTGIPPYSFSIDGGAFQTQTPPFTVSNLSSGTHTVEVTDFYGCGNVTTINILPPIGITPTVTALPSCNDDDGQIEVNATGGSGNYAYSIAPNPPSITLTGAIFSGVPSGTYTVTITDIDTMCTQDAIITLENATPVTFSTQVNPVSCNGASDGTITVVLEPGNDNPIYTYEIIAPIIIPAQTSNIFNGLPADTYTVLVTSGRNCELEMDVTIDEPTLLEVNATATQFSCNSDNTVSTATIIINETGGTPNYTYSINGINYFNTNIFEIIDTGLAQTITVYVRDTNGCIATSIITIEPLISIIATDVLIGNPIDCNGTGSVTIEVTGGSGNFNYQMLPNGTPQVSNVFDIPGPGTYYFQVNDLDTNCYVLTDPFIVTPYDEIDALLEATNDNDCFGDNNGELSLTINNYFGAYTYQVFDSAGTPIGMVVTANTAINPEIITGLPSGNYYVDIQETETPFCTTTSNSATIGTPSAVLELIISETSNVTCTNSEGTITAIASGGTNPYEFELTGDATVAYSSNNVFSNLSAGTYTVNVRDINGCIDSETITLEEPNPITADFVADATNLLCFGDQTATITVENVTGGQGSNFTYTLNSIVPLAGDSGPQTSNIFEGLGAGTYTVTITDSYDCLYVSPLPIVIDQPTPVVADLVAASTATCLTSPSLTLSAMGGTGIYEYSANENFNPVLGTFTDNITISVTEGVYSYYVRDINGCISNVSNEITFDPLPELEINLVSENPEINCAGDNTGTIEATAQGGLGDYVYILQDTNGTTIPATQNSPGIFTELVAGMYRVFVTSGDCEEISEDIEITEPDTALETTFEIENISCYGENDGRLIILASGGTGIIKYAISPQLNQFFDTPIFENLAPGMYDVIVQDELGCFVTFNFEITQPPQVIAGLIDNTTIPVICEGDANGAFSIEIQGGTPPYSVSINDYNGPYTTGDIDQTDFDFTNLGGGNHTVFVKDANGCESEWLISFPDAVFINPIVEVDYQCEDNQTVAIVTVNIDDSVDPSLLTYTLNDGPPQASNIFTNLPPGENYFITVEHANGCVVMTDFFDINEVEGLTLVLNNDEVNIIEAIVTGGTGIYEFTFNEINTGSINTYEIQQTGTYVIVVTDSSGCTATARITLDLIEICIPNYFSPNGDGIMDYWAPECVEKYPNLMFSIFDRYGRKVAMLRTGEKWDGRYKGTELPTGDYWFVIRTGRSNEKEYVGHFTLYR
ncbi:MAG: T9SS type B sorting domain-containing protein [Patiriisocius sp.]|uniref:T9SS type B sorting domain-containing protein n=1 Tax=Patiriisocius sp. TaxID=2822396 RepID=UPI003EFA3154